MHPRPKRFKPTLLHVVQSIASQSCLTSSPGPKGETTARPISALNNFEADSQNGSYAYVEFADPSIVDNAVKLDGTTFRGRLLKVSLHQRTSRSPS